MNRLFIRHSFVLPLLAMHQHICIGLIIVVASQGMPKSLLVATMSHDIVPMGCHLCAQGIAPLF